MSECGHVVIQKTYQYDRQKNITGEYWICVGCKLRFVPMGLAEAENAALKRVVADLIVTMKEPAIRGAKTVHQMCSFLDAWIVDLEQALLTTEEPE